LIYAVQFLAPWPHGLLSSRMKLAAAPRPACCDPTPASPLQPKHSGCRSVCCCSDCWPSFSDSSPLHRLGISHGSVEPLEQCCASSGAVNSHTHLLVLIVDSLFPHQAHLHGLRDRAPIDKHGAAFTRNADSSSAGSFDDGVLQLTLTEARRLRSSNVGMCSPHLTLLPMITYRHLDMLVFKISDLFALVLKLIKFHR